MDKNIKNLVKGIKENSNQAWDATFQLVFQRNDLHDPEYGQLPEEGFGDPTLRSRLNFELDKLYTSILMALEIIELPGMTKRIISQYEPVRRKMDSEDFLLSVNEPTCPALEILEEYSSALESLVGITESVSISGRNALKQVLDGTPVIIRDSGIEPSNEPEVQEKVFNTLKHVFPDTAREFTIPKGVKCYKPDFCIRSLNTAIEYKFCDSEDDIKKAVDGIIEDVGAYSNSDDWKYFYAVIYMTDSFMTQAQIETHLRESGVNEKWKIITVTGKGSRKKKL
ncbi:hypothetical protein ACPV5J_23355 [Vibrio rotiferianus]|uniref:PD-(D/E)XK nuclease domain-containing protein n=1 Tax=Vibrio rotiferianus TaxID=190895 RepID=UPI00406AA16C